MLKLIVTGPAGSGKSSLITEVTFESQSHYFYISADDEINNLYKKGNKGYEYIKANFGNEFISEKEVNKKNILNALSQSSTFRDKLEALIYPLLKESINFKIQKLNGLNHEYKYLIIEIPSMKKENYELFSDLADAFILVNSIKPIRIIRLFSKIHNLKKAVLINKLNEKPNYEISYKEIINNNLSIKRAAKKLKEAVES